MRHMLAQFGPCLKWPWTKLEAPELTEGLIDRMVEGTSAQADGRSIRELERLRDDCLVAIQQVLRQFNIGAGGTLKALETRLYSEAAARAPLANAAGPGPLKALEVQVRPEWIDYNGHLTDHRYLHIFGDAADALWRRVGIDEQYRAAGHALFTVESHVRHVAELRQSDTVQVTLQLLAVDSKRMHVFGWLSRADGTVAATVEQMFLHVDTRAGKTAPMTAAVLTKLQAIRASQASLPRPPEAGRAIGIRG